MTERSGRLVRQLRQYRNDQFAAGDLAAAAATTSAITSLECEGHGDRDYFLTALCFISIRSLNSSAADPNSVEEDAEPPDEPAG